MLLSASEHAKIFGLFRRTMPEVLSYNLQYESRLKLKGHRDLATSTP